MPHEYMLQHGDLGTVLRDQQKMSESIAAWRKTIALEPEHAWAHWNLGAALLHQGNFTDALTFLKRGHELGSRNLDPFVQTAELLRKAEQFARLDAKLPKTLTGETQPTDAAERLGLAGLCQVRQLYAAAARFYSEAFAADPELAGHAGSGNRYDAACAAALAGTGQGKDAGNLKPPELAKLPEVERQEWQKLWAEVEKLKRRAAKAK